MTKNRLEAFSDGVLAIVITIMVLEMKAPHEASWEALKHLLPEFGSYIISFLMIAIYWGNHHHLMHTITHVTSSIMWANTHLLFWLSLIPFATAWMGETSFSYHSVSLYGLLLTLCGIAYFILLVVMRNGNQGNKKLLGLLRHQMQKGTISLVVYSLSIIIAFFQPLVSGILFVLVGIMWLVPDRNIERTLRES